MRTTKKSNSRPHFGICEDSHGSMCLATTTNECHPEAPEGQRKGLRSNNTKDC